MALQEAAQKEEDRVEDRSFRGAVKVDKEVKEGDRKEDLGKEEDKGLLVERDDLRWLNR